MTLRLVFLGSSSWLLAKTPELPVMVLKNSIDFASHLPAIVFEFFVFFLMHLVSSLVFGQCQVIKGVFAFIGVLLNF